MNSSRIELLWLVWDQSRSKYYLRTKFQDGIDKPQKCHETYAITQRTSSKVTFLILVLYDFIVQSILSSLLFIVDVLIAVLFDPPHMYLCHVCMKKARKKYIFVQGFPTVPSLFFLPTLAHFIGIICKMPLSHHILAKHC